MPDLLHHEFVQVQEAINAAWELLRPANPVTLVTPEYQEKLRKIEAAKELMADLAQGNSR